MNQPNVLLIEDNKGDIRIIEEYLKISDFGSFNLFSTDTLENGLNLISENNLDIILLDLTLPDSQGLNTFKKVHQKANGLPIIVLTGLSDREASLEAVELGAQDYLTKDNIDSNILGRSIRYAIKRKQAEETLNHYTKQLEALNETASMLSTSIDLDTLLDIIFDQIKKIFPYDSSSIFLHENNKLRVIAQRGSIKNHVGESFPSENKLFQDMIAIKKPIVLNEPLKDQRFQNWSNSSEIKCWLGAPLIINDKVIGYITLDNNEPCVYEKMEGKLIMSFASHAAHAIENSRLVSELIQKTNRLSSLREIDHVISSSFDLDFALKIILDQVNRSLEVDASDILIYNEKAQDLRYILGQGFKTDALKHTYLHIGEGIAGKVIVNRERIIISDKQEFQEAFKNAYKLINEGFQSYIGVPLIVKGKIVGVLEIFNKGEINQDDDWFDFLETIGEQAAITIDNISMFNQLQKSNIELTQAYDATIEGWAIALELRDMDTEGHSRRVVDMSLELAREIGINDGTEILNIRRGALMHDLGKLGVPDNILQKPGKLTEDEWEIMKQHPTHAFNWLSSIPYLKNAIEIPYCHHEKWNGTGYPRGLKGNEIPISARIFAIIDVYDALISDRPYRKAWSKKKALEYIESESGKYFDPKIVQAFLKIVKGK